MHVCCCGVQIPMSGLLGSYCMKNGLTDVILRLGFLFHEKSMAAVQLTKANQVRDCSLLLIENSLQVECVIYPRSKVFMSHAMGPRGTYLRSLPFSLQGIVLFLASPTNLKPIDPGPFNEMALGFPDLACISYLKIQKGQNKQVTEKFFYLFFLWLNKLIRKEKYQTQFICETFFLPYNHHSYLLQYQ